MDTFGESRMDTPRSAAASAPVADLTRRRVLAGGAAAGLGVTALTLPAAIAAASEFDGGPDLAEAVAAGFNSSVSAVLVRTNSPEQIVVGGNFTAYGGTTLGADNPDGLKTRLLALTSSGTIDMMTSAAFPQLTVIPSALIPHTRTIDGQPDVGLLIMHATLTNDVAFTFESTPPSWATTPEEFSGRFLLRLKRDGSLDTEFNANVPLLGRTRKTVPSGTQPTVWGGQEIKARPAQVLVRSDGKIVLAGRFNEAAINASFTSLLAARADGAGNVVKRFGLVRFNADGTLDTGFVPDWGDNTDDYFSGTSGAGQSYPTILYPDATGVVEDAAGDLVLAAGSDNTGGGVVVAGGARWNVLYVNGTTGARITGVFEETVARDAFDGDTALVGWVASQLALTSDGSLVAVAPGKGLGLSFVRHWRRGGAGEPYYVRNTVLDRALPWNNPDLTYGEPNPAHGDGSGGIQLLIPIGSDRFIAFSGGTIADTPRFGHRLVTYTPGASPTLTATKFGSGVATVTSNDFGSARHWARLASGRLVAGGMFTTINGAARNNIAFLEADGTVSPVADA